MCWYVLPFFFFMDKVGQITYQEIAKVILNFKVANLIHLKMIEILQNANHWRFQLISKYYMKQERGGFFHPETLVFFKKNFQVTTV